MPLHEGKSKKVISENIREMEASGHSHDQAVAAALHNAHPNGGKNMAEGGTTSGNPAELDKPIQDASASDFLLPYLLSPSGLADSVAPKLASESGEISMGGMAPKMEEAADAASPKVQAFIKGVQKSPNGNEVKIWGVRGDPDEIAKLGYGSDPGSVPEHVLRAKGVLPEQTEIPQNAPNAYADGGFVENMKKLFGSDKSDTTKADDIDPVQPSQSPTTSTDTAKGYAKGGKIERSSLEHPVPNAMMARAMNEGGYAYGGTPEDDKKAKDQKPMDPVVAKGLPGVPALPGAQPTGDEKLENSIDQATTQAPQTFAKGGYPHVTFMENLPMRKVKEVTHLAGMPEHIDKPMSGVKESEGAMHMAEGGKTPHFLEGLKKGALHKEMGISEDKKIPEKKLEKAANSDDETLRKRAQFALNAKKWHHAEGGVIPHEEKMKQVYKAMGIKGYDDGGVSTSADQAPGAPNPNDPGFWDQVKAMLSQVGTSTGNALGLGNAPAPQVPPTATNPNLTAAIQAGLTGGANAAVAPLNPTATPATVAVPDADTSKTLGLPTAVPVPPVAAHSPVDLATVPPPAPMANLTGASAGAPPSTGSPLNNLFNQDTSKLTQGVNSEDRNALVQQLSAQQHSLPAMIAQAVAGLGDAFAAKGGKEQHSLQNIFSMQTQQRDEALANFDKARQDRIQKLALQTQMGQNAIQQLAAQDAYGTDENLNKMLGAPPGTAHKDLPLYFQAKAAGVAQQEKDADLYMKAHAQASTDVDNATKNASVIGIKPSAVQLQASGAKLADQYFNKAKGNILVKPSDGGPSQWIPAQNISKARQMDPNLQIIQ